MNPLNAIVWACLVGQAVLLVFAQFGFILTTQELPAHVGFISVHKSNCRDAGSASLFSFRPFVSTRMRFLPLPATEDESPARSRTAVMP